MPDHQLITAEDVQRWIEDDMTEGMRRVAGAAIESGSDQARMIGNPDWHKENVPAAVQRIVAEAVARFVRNSEAYAQSRAGDETLIWQERPDAGKFRFDAEEKARIAHYAQSAVLQVSTFGTIATHAWSDDEADCDETVPVNYVGGKRFPLGYPPRIVPRPDWWW